MLQMANVLVCRGVHDLYSYEIPTELSIQIGDRVVVPFGKTSINGIVVSIHPHSTQPYPLKPIESIAPHPLSSHQMALIQYLISRYLTSPYKAFQTVVGSHTRRVVPQPKTIPILPPNITLTPDQEAAIRRVPPTGFSTTLIHGITASGKTEVYMHLVQQQLSANRSSILLVPEIALTPQLSRLFIQRFGERVAVLHSGLTPKQRAVALSQIESGWCRVVIGPRSAVFADVENLGLMIVDECHDSSYKQESHPRYDSIDIARQRCEWLGIPLVLGSATPTLEQWANTSNRASMLTRVASRPLPEMVIHDMTDSQLFPDNSVIGMPLLNAIRVALTKGEKCMILVNRRGYAPSVHCTRCKRPLTCEGCQLPLTYHGDRTLRCHRCMTLRAYPPHCPDCPKGRLEMGGTAIQRVTIELTKLLPGASIYRLDRDTATTHKKMMGILDGFKSDGDILVGTQMIAKGHDIPEVTVVGLVGIDTALSIPDFRATERAFQLIVQVAGRAGRGEKPGVVMIQTTQPTHYAIQLAAQQACQQFIDTEMGFRKQLWYPPFCRLINIMASGLDREMVQRHLNQIYVDLNGRDEQSKVYPPCPSPVEMIKRHHRWHILIKTTDEGIGLFIEYLRGVPIDSRVKLIVDIDPQSIV